MKIWRIICLITLVFISVLGTSISTGQASGQVNITVDGKEIAVDVAPYIDENARTMVPVRFVSEALGCVVSWNAGEQRVRISHTGSAVDLHIGEKTAHINGVEKEMDTTAVLKAGRTMVPLRFLAETFGLNVNWKEEQRTVAIKSPATLPGEESSAPGSDEDKQSAPGSDEDELPNLQIGIVTGNLVNIRSGPGTDNARLTQVAMGTRLTILEEEPAEDGVWLQVEIPGGDKGWIAGWLVEIQNQASTTEDINLDGDYAMPAETARSALVMKESVNVRSAPGVESPVISKVSSGQQLDIIGEEDNWFAVKLPDGRSGWIAGWLAAVKYDADKKETPADSSRVAGLISRWSSGAQTVEGDLPALTGIEVEGSDGVVFLKVSAASYLAMPSSFRLDNPSRIVFDFPACLGEEESSPTLQADHGPVSSFRVGQFDEQTVRIVADLQSQASYALTRSSDGRTITIQIKSVNLSEQIIVIDPGHGALQTWGGSDPGAIGPTGLRERDVVRSISLQVGNILLNEGLTVIYTCEGDTGLTLEERAAVASISGAELLVSIHNNASTDRSLSGTMTFYYAPPGTQEKQVSERKTLASFIQTELVNRLQRDNKGIREENFAVLRNCPIPAVLVEVAFISNPEEEKLLADQAFQRRAAEAIALGIKRYLAAH